MNYINKDFDLQQQEIRVGTDCAGLETPLLALKLLNAKIIHCWSCDNDRYIKEYIKTHHSPIVYYDNIIERNHHELPDIDLYVCGFCCQPFSGIGLKQGFDCLNGSVFWECCKVIEAKKPKYFVLENVKSIMSHNQGKTMATIKQKLKDFTEYNIAFEVLNTMHYGIPQHRQRLYIIGVRKDLPKFKLLPFTKPLPPVREFLDTNDVGDINKCLIPRRKQVVDAIVEKKNIDMSDDWVITTGASLSFARSNKNYCPCITANCTFYYITSLQRFLNKRELSRLQGYPDDFPIAEGNKAYKHIGNAMSLNVIYHVLASLLC